MTIMQGDSYPIYINLTQDGTILAPETVGELEICLGRDGDAKEALRKIHSEDEVLFDTDANLWYIHPTQAETLALEVGFYNVIARIRYKDTGDGDVVGVKVGRIQVINSISEAVI